MYSFIPSNLRFQAEVFRSHSQTSFIAWICYHVQPIIFTSKLSHSPFVGERCVCTGQNYPLPKHFIVLPFLIHPPHFSVNSIMSSTVFSLLSNSKSSQLLAWNNGTIPLNSCGFFYRWQKIGSNGYFRHRKWNRQPNLGVLLRTCSSDWAAYRFREIIYIYIYMCVSTIHTYHIVYLHSYCLSLRGPLYTFGAYNPEIDILMMGDVDKSHPQIW